MYNQRAGLSRHSKVDLEFDPMGQMLYMGKYGQEEMWLAMVPWSFTEEDGMENDRDMEEQWRRMEYLEGLNMTMSDEHYSIMMMYLAHALKVQG